MCFVRYAQRAPLTARLVCLWERDLVSVRQAYELTFYIQIRRTLLGHVVPWRRRLVACTCLLQRTSGFDPRQVHAIFIMDTVKRGQIFLRVLRFSPVSIIPPVLHTHLHVILTRRTNGQRLINFHKQCAFGNL